MACNCGPGESTGLNAYEAYEAYQGLSQIDIGALAGVFSNAQDMWNNLVEALGIGAGRREADVIVPIQNKMVSDVIAPVYAYLDAVNNKGKAPDCSTIRDFAAEVNAAEKQWLNYLHLTKWQDGRAATQAEATLAPYFTQSKTGLQDLITKDCGSIGGSITDTIGNTINSIIKTPTGEMNWPVIAIAAGAAFFLIRRK